MGPQSKDCGPVSFAPMTILFHLRFVLRRFFQDHSQSKAESRWNHPAKPVGVEGEKLPRGVSHGLESHHPAQLQNGRCDGKPHGSLVDRAGVAEKPPQESQQNQDDGQG